MNRAAPTASLDQPALRVMTFNVRVDTRSDGDNDWTHRRELAPAAMRFHQADVIGVQEATAPMNQDIHARLPGYAWVGVGTSDGEAAGAFNPVYWRESRLELMDWRTLWLSETPDTPSTDWDAEFPRTATYAHFRDLRSGRSLHIFNTHLDHAGEIARLESARLLKRWIGELPATEPVILLGDFNCNAASVPLTTLTADGLCNARDVSVTPPYGPSGSFTGFAGPQYTGPLIDHILIRNLHVQQIGVLPDHADGRLPSDHFPVLAEVVITGPSPARDDRR